MRNSQDGDVHNASNGSGNAPSGQRSVNFPMQMPSFEMPRRSVTSEYESLMNLVLEVRDCQKDIQSQILGLAVHSRKLEQKVDRLYTMERSSDATGPSLSSEHHAHAARQARVTLRHNFYASQSTAVLGAVDQYSDRSHLNTRSFSRLQATEDRNGGVPSPQNGWPGNLKPRAGLVFSQKRSRRALFGRGPTIEGGDMSSSSRIQSHVQSEVSSRTLALSSAPTPDEAKPVRQKTWAIKAVDPNSMTRVFYDLFMVLVCAIELTVTPYTVAWDVPMQGLIKVWVGLSLIFWLFDIGVNFLTGFYIDGELELDLGEIAKAYLKSYFFLDVFICMGQMVSLIADAKGETIRAVLFSRILRLSRMLRLVRLIRTLQAYFSHKRSGNITIVLHCAGISIAILWLAHLLACLWFAIGRLAPSDTGQHWIDEMMDGEGGGNLLYQYLTAYHFSLQQLAAGSMDMRPTNSYERHFNILCLLFGWLGGSSIVASLSTIMIEVQSHWKERSRKLEILQLFLEQNGVNHQFSVRVLNQVLNKVDKVERISEDRVQYLGLMSPMLKAQLYEQMYGPPSFRLPALRIWAFRDAVAFRALCEKAMVMNTFTVLDTIFESGQSTECCFVLISGKLCYTQMPEASSVQEEATIDLDEEGVVLSEASLWSKWTHVGLTEAIADTAILVIDCACFATTLSQSREAQDFLFEYGRIFFDRLTNMNRSVLPTDLHVPATDFEEIVMAMDFGWRRMAGWSALNAFEKQQSLGLFRSRKGLEELQEEVNQGKCTLIQDKKGEVIRMVAVTVLRLTNNFGYIWALVGKFENGELTAEVKLPGSKLAMGVTAGDALEKMLYKVMRPLVGGVSLCSVDTQQTSGKSGTFGVTTKYVRTIHNAELSENWEFPEQDESFRMANLPTKQAFIIQDDEGRDLIYCWLSEEEFSYFSGNTLWARADLLDLLDPLLPDPPQDWEEPPGRGFALSGSDQDMEAAVPLVRRFNQYIRL